VRILAVGHPESVATNQEPYAALVRDGVDVQLVVPDRWHHELEGEVRPAEVHPDLEGRVHLARIARPGSIQGHVHLTPPGRWLRKLQPDVVLVNEEHFSVPAAQWVQAARVRRVPVAINAWENLDRPLPWPARVLRHTTLRASSGVFARTPAAAQWARRWGARGRIDLVPPPIVSPAGVTARPRGGPFTVGFAGRLVEAKGVLDLLAAVDRLGGQERILVAGDGPLRSEVAADPKVDLRLGVRHDEMGAVYAEMDVLVLPSHTTRTWSEQLGRVLLEAMAHGRPVIAAASGEMPWVLSEARGGMTYPEGDVPALADLLIDARSDPDRWRALGERGRADVVERFSPEASGKALLALATGLHRSGSGQ
jgi:glycosyltransferase involved in cell wall biosynthesis